MSTQPVPTPDRRTRQGIAAIAGARSLGWSLISDALAPPGSQLVARLRSGEFVEEMRLATSWLGDDAGRFLDSFMSLDVYARRAARRTGEQDLEDLRAEYSRLFPEGPPTVRSAVRDMAARCDEEADAWGTGDHERAKRLRAEQFEVLESDLVDSVPRWCVWLAEDSRVALYRSVARLISSYLSVESGRDFDRLHFSD